MIGPEREYGNERETCREALEIARVSAYSANQMKCEDRLEQELDVAEN